MKLILSFILIIGLNASTFACTCAPHSLCNLLEFTEDDDRTVIFMGSYIQEQSINAYTKAFQYKVEKIYRGEIITPDSPLYNGEPYFNSDTTAWLLSGSDVSCYRYLNDSKAIFIVSYNENWLEHDSIGYVPTICRYDHFMVSGSTVTGAWPGNDFTMDLAEFENRLTNGCSPSSTSTIDNSTSIKIYPNPITDFLNIEINNVKDSWQISLFDTAGNLLRESKATSIDMSEFESGIYFLVVDNGSNVWSKKIVKI